MTDVTTTEDAATEPEPHGQTQEAGGAEVDSLGLDAADVPDTATTAEILEEMAKADAPATAALRQQWGGEAARNIAFAQSAVRQLATAELISLLDGAEVNGVAIGSHPALVQAAAHVGRLLAGADGGPSPARGPRGGTDRPSSAESRTMRGRLDELHGLQFADPVRYRSEAVQRELGRLYDRLHGGAAIVGRDGRVA